MEPSHTPKGFFFNGYSQFFRTEPEVIPDKAVTAPRITQGLTKGWTRFVSTDESPVDHYEEQAKKAVEHLGIDKPSAELLASLPQSLQEVVCKTHGIKIEEIKDETDSKKLIKNKEPLPNQKFNPHIHLAVREFIRFFAPTIGGAFGSLEWSANHFWTSFSSLTRSDMASRPQRLKETKGNPFEPRILEALDNGMVTGFLETGIHTAKPILLDVLNKGEEHLYSACGGKKIDGKKAEPIRVKNETSNPIDDLPASRFKRTTQNIIYAVKSVFSFLINFSYKTFQFLRNVTKVEVDDLRNEEQKKTDEAMKEFIHAPIKNFLKALPPFMKKLLPIGEAIGEGIGDKLIDMISIRLKIFRDYLFGEQNQERVSRLLDGIVNNVCDTFGKRLENINTNYFVNRYDGTLVEDFCAKTISDSEKYSLRESMLIHEVSKEFAHPAILPLTFEEAKIYANKETIEKEFEEVLKSQIACHKQLGDFKRSSVHKDLVVGLEEQALVLKAKSEEVTPKFKLLKDIEYRMEQAEKAYLKNLCEKFIDTFLFPKGIPFYWNVTVLLPDVVQIASNVFSFLTNTKPAENDTDRVKALQSVFFEEVEKTNLSGETEKIRKPKALKFREIKFRDVRGINDGYLLIKDNFSLIGTVFNRNVGFKGLRAKEFVTDLVANALFIALKFGLNTASFFADPQFDKITAEGDKAVLEKLNFLISRIEPSLQLKDAPLHLGEGLSYLITVLGYSGFTGLSTLLLGGPGMISGILSLVLAGFCQAGSEASKYADKIKMLKERLGMERINKYMIYSILDAAIDVCQKEAINTITKSATPLPLVPEFEDKRQVVEIGPTLEEVKSASALVMSASVMASKAIGQRVYNAGSYIASNLVSAYTADPTAQ